MSLFGSKGPTPQEEKKARIVKANLVEHLGQALQLMQMNHIQSEDPIYSGDSANAVCNVLEAIFLHEIKEQSFNFSSYFAASSDKIQDVNFWSFLKKFTHKGVVSQLENLSQIETDIGRCRAWLRLAMNDGLIESYVDAMIADKRTLRTYYRSTSFLRDNERPDILKTYLQGLNQFVFQLSHNSSMLNIWTHTPLILAGLVIANETPNAVVVKPTPDLSITKRKVSDARIVDLGRNKNSLDSASVPNKKNTKTDQDSTTKHIDLPDAQVPDIRIDSTTTTTDDDSLKSTTQNAGEDFITPPNTPHEVSVLLNRSLEELNVAGIAASREPQRLASFESSPTSTPPNTPYGTVYLTKEVLLRNVAEDIANSRVLSDRNSSLKTSQQRNNFKADDLNDNTIVKSANDQNIGLKDSEQQQREIDPEVNDDTIVKSEEDQNESSYHNTGLKDLKPERQIDLEAEDFNDNTSPATDVEISQLRSSPLIPTVESLLSSGSDYQTATSNSSQPLTPTNTPFDPSPLRGLSTTDEFESLTRKLEKDLNERDAQSAIEVDLNSAATEVENTNSSSPEELEVAQDACLDYASGSPTEGATADKQSAFPTRNRRRSDPVPPQVSPAIAWATKDEGYILRAVEKLRDSANSLSQNIFGGDSETNRDEDAARDDASGSFKGNKLGLDDMMGWSSAPLDTGSSSAQSLQTENEPIDSNSLEQTLSLSNSQDHPNTDESYNTLLKDYATPSITIPAPTISSVIENLTANSPTGSAKSIPKNKPNAQINENPADFEVIPFSASITSHNAEPSIQAFMSVLGEICNEKGLDVQNYQCRGCSKPIGMIYGSYRVCRYDGFYYCTECHKNDEYYIPSRIAHNWDFRKFKVSKDSKCFLLQIQEEPMLNIEEINPKLYSHVEEMNELKALREQLMSLKAYLFTCQQSVADELRKKIWPKEYLYDNAHLYSLCDLIQVHSGQLAILLKKIIRFASKHVYECRLCSQKGFYCEICDIPKVIYPFEFDTTTKCTRCKSVFHRDCKDDLKPCPKCERWRTRQNSLIGNTVVTTPEISDFAFRPNFNESENGST
ncbi:pleckstrin homology domain-containing family M member 1-like isoform X2 [Tubulanus polymorphus]|uniref:pleckstrin homology domain-containing family M member 1-like isoform X2 n=1 Tax=Tubulanus polymorphus TaxID=672921 RepID=UPI003DA657AF